MQPPRSPPKNAYKSFEEFKARSAPGASKIPEGWPASRARASSAPGPFVPWPAAPSPKLWIAYWCEVFKIPYSCEIRTRKCTWYTPDCVVAYGVMDFSGVQFKGDS